MRAKNGDEKIADDQGLTCQRLQTCARIPKWQFTQAWLAGSSRAPVGCRRLRVCTGDACFPAKGVTSKELLGHESAKRTKTWSYQLQPRKMFYRLQDHSVLSFLALSSRVSGSSPALM